MLAVMVFGISGVAFWDFFRCYWRAVSRASI